MLSGELTETKIFIDFRGSVESYYRIEIEYEVLIDIISLCGKKGVLNMIKTNGEQVLLYGMKDLEKERRLKGILIRMGVRIKNVAFTQCGEKVGYLAGIKGFEPSGSIEEREPVQEEMMILKGFSNMRLDLLLKEMKKNNARVDLKAIVTENNQHWNLWELSEELRKEHEAMKQN